MIFSKPISELEKEDVEAFCEDGPKEGFILEYKGDFTGRIEKVICAFANTWGGVLLIGVNEDAEGKPVSPIDGVKFEKGLDLRVTNKIMDNIYPPVFVDKKVIPFEKDGEKRAVIVVGVPESNMTPHSCDQGESIYVRTDERNKPYKRATVGRIEWLWNRREKSEKLKQQLYVEAIERVAKIRKKPSLWTISPLLQLRDEQPGLVTFSVIPMFPNQAYTSTEELEEIFQSQDLRIKYYRVPETFAHGSLEPKTTQQSVLGYTYSEDLNIQGLIYHEINTYGMVFYQEPFLKRINFGGTVAPVIRYNDIIARLDQFLEYSKKLYDKLNIWGLVEITVKVDDVFEIRMMEDTCGELFRNSISHQDNIEVKKRVYKDELMSKRLEILNEFIREIGHGFNLKIQEKQIENYLKDHNRLDLTT